MPRSGGGGSHRSGSHHSSHHSSHRSGSGGSSGPRYSKMYYPGARRYVYYYNRQPHYYYANRKMTRLETKSAAFSLIGMGIFWLVISIFCFSMMCEYHEGGISMPSDNAIVIDDGAGVISNSADLKRSLEAFRDRSGVPVCIVTRKHGQEEYGDTTENQSYNAYVSRWDDEKHWLIYYVGDKKNRSDDWEWNLMCGYECSSVINMSNESDFIDNFNRYLVAGDRYTFDQALTTALDKISVDTSGGLFYRDNVRVNGEYSGGERIDNVFFIFFLIFPEIGILLVVGGVVSLAKANSPEKTAMMNATEIPATAEPMLSTCEYCQGTFVSGTVNECPHCAAPIRF